MYSTATSSCNQYLINILQIVTTITTYYAPDLCKERALWNDGRCPVCASIRLLRSST